MAHIKRTLFCCLFAAPYVAASFYLTLTQDFRTLAQDYLSLAKSTRAEQEPATLRRMPVPSAEQRSRLTQQPDKRPVQETASIRRLPVPISEQQNRQAEQKPAAAQRVAMPGAKRQNKQAEQQHKQLAQKPVAAKPGIDVPNAASIVLLVRTTLLTLNNGLQSGNFTVLREVSSPAFRKGNSEAQLAHAFKPYRDNKVNLISAAVNVPKFFQKPVIDDRKLLHLKGYFPGQRTQIHFDLAFQIVQGRWRLLRLSVNLKNVAQGAAINHEIQEVAGSREVARAGVRPCAYEPSRPNVRQSGGTRATCLNCRTGPWIKSGAGSGSRLFRDGAFCAAA